MKKYIGQIIEIIYLDRLGQVSQRQIKVHAVKDGLVRATCMKIGAPRAFRLDRVLAYAPVKKNLRNSSGQAI